MKYHNQLPLYLHEEANQFLDSEENLIPQDEQINEELREAIEEYFNPPKVRKDLYAISWLAGEIKVDYGTLLEMIDKIRKGVSVYEIRTKSERDGGQRKIYAPDKALKDIQRKINKNILEFLNPSKNIFGFSGGNVVDAITPHLSAECVLRVDLINAFSTIKTSNILGYFTEGRVTDKKTFGFYGREKIIKKSYFSWYAAKALTDLIAFDGILPQGARTSPRMFDLMLRPIDQRLLKLAKNVKGIYTRYADNIFFSIGKEKFPRPLRQAIVKIIEGRRFKGYNTQEKYPHLVGFGWHKLTIKQTNNTSQRMLGLNVINGQIHNTRSFKRRLRLAIHHINWLTDHGKKYEKAWLKLKGQMNFARRDTLPPKLLCGYLELEKRLI